MIPPRTDPNGRLLAHSVLISDDWRQSELRDRDGAHAVAEASDPLTLACGSTRTYRLKASVHVSLGDLSGNQVISDGVSNEFSIAVELEYLHNAVFVKGNCTSLDV